MSKHSEPNDRARMRRLVMDVIERGWNAPLDESEFDDIALRVFRFQYENNAAYRAFCERRGSTPDTASSWTEIPAVPTAAFREVALATGAAAEAEAVFRTSGTTRGAERRGTHYVLDVSVYEASLLSSFRECVLPDGVEPRILSLVPEPAHAPDSSLSHMMAVVLREFGAAGSDTFADAHGIDHARLAAALRAAERAGDIVCVAGTSFAFVHWLDDLTAAQERFQLPEGSRLMDTGGFKGRSRVVAEPELRAMYASVLGIAGPFVVNEYGMTEMCSQFYDAHLRDRVAGRRAAMRKVGPPWVRSRVVHPETLAPLPHGETGILRHHDLANVFSVSAVQTEDLAVAEGDGFRLLGRAPGAAPRGCSVAMDMLLEAVGRTRTP